MPYESNSELPDSVREALPSSAQSVFRNVVNAQLKRGLAESRAFRSAWGALKNQGWEKGDDGKWRKTEKGEAAEQYYLKGEITKADDEQQLVFGWASIIEDADGNPVVDKQGDTITPDELEKGAYEFVLDARIAGEMHQNTEGVGRLVESVVLTKEKQSAMGLQHYDLPVGWWLGFKVSPDVFEKVKSGDYRMFSIGGRGRRVPEPEED